MRKSLKVLGFTLIELMVVITIISILVAVLNASFQGARDNARNKAIQSSLSEMQLAIELYKSQTGAYPATLSALVPEYISQLPTNSDSGNSSCNLTYAVDSPSGAYYKYTAANCFVAASAAEGIKSDSEFARCPSSCSTCAGSGYSTYVPTAAFYESLAVYSLGGECL